MTNQQVVFYQFCSFDIKNKIFKNQSVHIKWSLLDEKKYFPLNSI